MVDKYINELSNNTAMHVSDVFADKCNSIESIAHLYGKAIKSTQVDYELLASLEEKSGFDWIRFVATDGTDYTSNGSVINVKDREYFISGMEGKCGICEVQGSRINGQKMVGFYAPVYFDGEICGIMVGLLSEITVSDILDINLYGYPANTYILRKDGNVVGRNMGEGTYEFDDISVAIDYVEKSYRKQVQEAIYSHQKCKFIFKGTEERSIGYVIPIASTKWSLVQLFPSEATNIVMQTTHKDTLVSFFILVVIFIVFIITVIIIYKNNSKERTEELAYNKVNSLMRSVSDDYVCLIDVDLATRQEVRYNLAENSGLKDWSDGQNDYTHCISQYADMYVAEYDRERFIKSTKLPALFEVLNKQKYYYIDYDVLVDGNTLKCQGKFTISSDKQFDNHILISIRDITDSIKERDEKEKELAEARRMAESANNAKTRFLFNMSHDIRTPMNAIIGYTNLIGNNINNREKIAEYVNKIKHSSDFLLSLINNVLEMARIESGETRLDETLWNVEQFNDTLISVFEDQFEQKKLNFTKEINVIHTDVYCDTLKLKQIYLNIISNAIKYTPEGGSIKLVLNELPSEKEGYAIYECCISDTGIGMSKEFVSHIFEEFTREASETESRIAGSGLGMPIVKRLIELMDGTIEVDSRLGEGTTFTVSIPHRIADRKAIDNMKKSAVEYNDMALGNIRVLLAEDNDMNAEIAQEILSSIGVEVQRAKDGVECVHMVQESEEDYYDLVLMDIQMPNMNGYEAAKTIRRIPGKRSEIPIIAMTANAFEEDRRNALEAGMNDHIPKPIDVQKLINTIRIILG